MVEPASSPAFLSELAQIYEMDTLAYVGIIYARAVLVKLVEAAV